MRAAWKALKVFSILGAYFIISLFIRIFIVQKKKRSCLAKNTSFFSILVLRALGVRATIQGRNQLPRDNRSRLLVSNHLSSVDILIISAHMPAVFITSVELKNTPLAGWLAAAGGSIFVERRSRAGLKKEITTVARTLNDGFSVVLFPEGTTSPGEEVRPFKNSLFDAAIRTDREILPLCIRYRKVNNEDMTARSREAVFYHKIPFYRHAMGLLSVRSVDVELVVLESIRPHAQDSRKELATRAHRAISTAYHA
ncbi:MAG TPA: hypothetical protein DCO77_04435 [Nitrospiraceae bacterium]|nr:hypothetical protein [Nitrospiraceae bacterium]